MSMDGTFVSELCDRMQRGADVKKVGGRDYLLTRNADGSMSMVENLPRPRDFVHPLKVTTLQGLVDYMATVYARDVPEERLKHTFLHVVDHQGVQLCVGAQSDTQFSRREHPITAIAPTSSYVTGQWTPVADLVLALRTSFAASEDRGKMIDILGRVRDERVRDEQNDAISQSVTIRRGITAVTSETIPPDVKLRPYRTFSELDQPECSFVVRLKNNGDDAIMAKLVEVESGLWSAEAIASIKTWLESKISELPEAMRIPVI